MKKVVSMFLTSLLILQCMSFEVSAKTPKFGVFTGAEPKDISKFLKYDEIVIDASIYSKKDIENLRKKGIKVYSYLNIGSIEKFRPYYKQFQKYTLGKYENWNDERWMDVSNGEWKKYIVTVLAKNLMDKGIDGFFIDNVDVYSKYKKENIYNGLISILTELNRTGKKVIVNGGYDFFTAAMKNGVNIKSLAYGINVESVFTDIDFKNGEFLERNQIDKNYALEYLKLVKKKGVNIYIIEYSNNDKLNSQIKAYYEKEGYRFYIASNIALN